MIYSDKNLERLNKNKKQKIKKFSKYKKIRENTKCNFFKMSNLSQPRRDELSFCSIIFFLKPLFFGKAGRLG